MTTSWKKSIPVPRYDQDPSLIDLYWKAWELSYDHVVENNELPQSPYMDEGFADDTIWIWDTCFMSLFCKYAQDTFPGYESLQNFYQPLHSGKWDLGELPLRIQHLDNPPLFAWVEHDNFFFSNNIAHIKKLLKDDAYLQKHFHWFDQLKPGYELPNKKSMPVAIEKHDKGYLWNGVASGMDNTPRVKRSERPIYWIDAIAQQGLSALYISRLAGFIGDDTTATEWMDRYNDIKTTINTYYWNEKDGLYYDIDAETLEQIPVRTPAAYWPMLAEMCTQDQAKRLASAAIDPDIFGGTMPWPTVTRDDPHYENETGEYWNGAIWLPTAYMGTKALEKYSFHTEAHTLSKNLLAHMNKTYQEYDPPTIWECYSPSKPTPSSHRGERVRPDFCGWSALGPISLFIENILGIYKVEAHTGSLWWNLTDATNNKGATGLSNLTFGKYTVDIRYENNKMYITTNHPLTVHVPDKTLDIPAGESVHPL